MLAPLLGLLGVGCGSVDRPVPRPPPPPPPPRPDLVVLLVVDQLPIRLAEAVAADATGGLKRLREGYVSTARHRHLATETCPGHAVLSTGASPHRSGIVANGWLEGGEPVYCTSAEAPGAKLLAEALADRVTDAGGRAVSLALKDRAAAMLGGHHPTAAVWWDAKAGGPTGIGLHAVGPTPEWRCEGKRVWTPLPERAAAYAALGPDADPHEDGGPFPHEVDCADASAFRGSPDAGRWLVDAAIGAVDHLALGDGHTDLLAVSFSHVDYIGHAYTPDSWEARDAVARLDLELGRLFDHLDTRLPGRWAAALSSDHGAPGAPRWLPVDAAERATAAAAKVAGVPKVEFEEPWVWTPGATAEQRAAALGSLRASLGAVPGVLAVVDPTDRATWPPGAKVAEALALGTFPGRSGDLAVLRADGYQWESRRRDGTVRAVGTTHGSTDDLDQRVPMWFTGAGVRPGVAAADLDVRQLAPTLGALLGVGVPAQAEVPLVREAIDGP